MNKKIVRRLLGGAVVGIVLASGAVSANAADNAGSSAGPLSRQSRSIAPKPAKMATPQAVTPATPIADDATFADPTSRTASFVGCQRDAAGNAFVDIDVTVSGGRWSTTTLYNPSDIHVDGAPFTRHFKMLTSSGVIAFNPTWTYLPRDIGTITLFDLQSGVGHRYLPENSVVVDFTTCR